LVAAQRQSRLPRRRLSAPHQRGTTYPVQLYRSSANSGGRSIAQIADEKFVDEVVVAVRDRAACRRKTCSTASSAASAQRVSHLLGARDRPSRHRALHPGWLFFSDGFRANWYTNLIKRAVRNIVSLIAVTVTLPIVAVFAAAIRIEGSGPISTPGTRRTERQAFSDDEVPQHVGQRGNRRQCPSGRRRTTSWITRIGALMRQTRIDEIPQIFTSSRAT